MIRRIFSRSSLLTLLILVVGFLGAFGLPQQFGITTDQLILALLAATGLELLLERVGQLSSISDAIEEVKTAADRHSSADALFVSRSNSQSFDELIAGAREVWIAGKSLHGLANSHGDFMLESGIRFRFLAHDPDAPHIAESLATQSRSNPSTSHFRAGLAAGVEQLGRLSEEGGDRIDVRLSSALILNGFTIVDPTATTAVMRIELFSYQVSLGSRRSIVLRRNHDPVIFQFYLDQYTKLWAAGRTFESSAS